MKSFLSFTLVVLAVVVLVAAGSSARATVIAYDGFGTSGALVGTSTGTGWAAAWAGSGSYSSQVTLVASSLAEPSGVLQPPTGGGIQETHTGSSDAAVYRQLSSTLSSGTAGTWYVCFDYAKTNGTGSDYGFFGLASSTTATNKIQAGANYSGGSVYYLGGTASICTPVNGASITDNNPHYYVMKLVSTGANTINGYLNIYAQTDTLPATEPASWTYQVTYTFTTTTTFGYVWYNGRVYTAGSPNLPNYLDEVQITTAWSDIVAAPSPEPSTLALLVTGLAGLLAYAWRKRR